MEVTRYTQQCMNDEANSLNQQNDELMIANILGALNNPIITKLMDEKELVILCQAVKSHVVERANKIVEIQNKEQQKQNTSGRFK